MWASLHPRLFAVYISPDDILLLGGDLGAPPPPGQPFRGGTLHHSYSPGHFAEDVWTAHMVPNPDGSLKAWWFQLKPFVQALDTQIDASGLLARAGHAAAVLPEAIMDGTQTAALQWRTHAVFLFGGRSVDTRQSAAAGGAAPAGIIPTRDRCDSLLAIPDLVRGKLRVLKMVDDQQCRRHMLASQGPMPRHGASVVALQPTSRKSIDVVVFGGACTECTEASARAAGLTKQQFAARLGASHGLVFADVWVMSLSISGLHSPGSQHAWWTAVRPASSSQQWPAPIPRSMHTAGALHHDTILVIGGAQCLPGCTDLGDVWLLQLTQGRWEWALREPLSPAQCVLSRGGADSSTCVIIQWLVKAAVDAAAPAVEGGAAPKTGGGDLAAADLTLKGFAAQALQDARVQRKVSCVDEVCILRAIQALGGHAAPEGQRLPGSLDNTADSISSHQASMAVHPLAGMQLQVQGASAHLLSCLEALKGVVFLSGGESFAPYRTFGRGVYLTANSAAASSRSKVLLAGSEQWLSPVGIATLLVLVVVAVLAAAAKFTVKGQVLFGRLARYRMQHKQQV